MEGKESSEMTINHWKVYSPNQLHQHHSPQEAVTQDKLFDVKVVYISGKQIQIADCLSQLIKQGKDDDIEGLNLIGHDI